MVARVAGEVGERDGEDGAAGVENQVDRSGQELKVEADGCAAATLDAIPHVGLAEGLGHGETDARAGGFGAAGGGAGGEEVGEMAGVLPAGQGVGVLVVGVLAEAVGLGHAGLAELLGDGAGEGGDVGAGVLGGDGFDEDDVGFDGGGGVVAGAARDDEGVSGKQGDGAAVRGGAANGEGAREDDKELVLVVVGVPGELPEDAGNLEVLVVDLGEDAGGPEVGESGGEVEEGEGFAGVERRRVWGDGWHRKTSAVIRGVL